MTPEEEKALKEKQEREAVLCRAAVQIAPTAAEGSEILYLPMGVHQITPDAGGIGKPIKVLVDREAALETEKLRQAIVAKGKKPYFDLNHDDSAASFWPREFFWRENEGVIATGDWSGTGKRSVAEKDFCAFSPVFNVDDKRADPARVVFKPNYLKPNMGGLVNDPAFNNLPLWAKNDAPASAGAPSDESNPNNKKETMTPPAQMKRSSTSLSIEAESPKSILGAFVRCLEMNSAIRLTSENYKLKGMLAREAAAIFARDISENPDIQSMSIEEAVKAADVSDTSVGLLSGTLVLQRALPLLQFEYPVLSTVFSDFSDEPGLFNETADTRIILKPAVQTYDPTADTAGRPKGWGIVSPAQTVDVPIKLDEYIGVPIVFGVQTLAQTVRRLFDETAPMALYALGGYFVKKLAALLTAANYPAYSIITIGTGVTTSGSNICTAASTAGMYPGQAISGTGIPAFCYVSSISADTVTFTITQKATATNGGLTFALGPGFDDAGVVLPVPNLYPTYVSALADFNMASLGQIGAAFDAGMVPQGYRYIMLNASYYARLAADPSFNTFFAAMRNPEIITKGVLPELQGLTPQKAPWFPSSGNRVGFAYNKAALVLKTRLPQDFTQAVGAMVPGSVTTVTAPSGISVLLVQYVNLQSNYAEWRPEVMLGAGLGIVAPVWLSPANKLAVSWR